MPSGHLARRHILSAQRRFAFFPTSCSGRRSHLLGVLLAFVHFLVEFLQLVGGHRGLFPSVGLSGGRQLLLFAGHVVGLLGSLELKRDAFNPI